jgi:asparagine synthase (glutamine-hydrolysing)
MAAMCGFAGEFLFSGTADLDLARRMADRLAHRGPDDAGEYLSPDGRCAIGFRRLAVIDPAGSRQPMTCPRTGATVAFNGEIYNFRDLRADLSRQGWRFQTEGDTETLLALHALSREDLPSRLSGMFAFALYDPSAGRLILARDRMGQKPLWYAALADRIVFASEAKALLPHPKVNRSPDRGSILYYATLGYIPAPRTAWAGLLKLPPASMLEVRGAPVPVPMRYWSPDPVAIEGTKDACARRVRQAVESAVSRHMVSDVPVGALLSGGIDSSIIVALMCRQAGQAGGVRTFTAGFDNPRFDERPRARRLAESLGADHTELRVEPRPAEVLDAAAGLCDEPFADSSLAATWLIAREARKHVTVALAGDGGDECFAGYDRYAAMSIYESVRPLRYFFLRAAGAVAGAIAPPEERNRLRRLARFSAGLPYPFPEQYFMIRRLFSPSELVDLFAPGFMEDLEPEAPRDWFWRLYEDIEVADEVTRAQRHDMLTYLPDDLLVKTDTASMAVSLELRAPFLDPQIVTLGLSLPPCLKIHRRMGKQALRLAFDDLLPADVFDHPKRGFGLPLGDWLRGDLQAPMKEALLDNSFLNAGIFRPAAIRGLINDHVTRRYDHRHRLWAMLMLAKWLGRNGRE